ncbi:MAG TPA: hypothetical protein PKC09_14955 [Paracoccus sp. (in: a-proteobacteria)]|mgnify:CR=1 FL=1|uniref:hypothetical protein n=1 Tax=uncultured Paracoccus sp. TaxID=189685 RepID=UPI00261E787A|nr:hypothetical protein [uncultured Paracoccus sp.]HMQ42560.1 hypothetical protein [Paracoccus sp. (in: a-proteobacteria)]HMR35825.1 hypothetical protein [Paracoccus sp. (in: a-proteobacteria)]
MSTKRFLAAGLVTATLAGCAIPNDQAVPDHVTFVGNRLKVTLSNGQQCYSDNIAGSAAGTFDHCPIPMRYDVRMASRAHLATGLTEPYADILVTMPDGRTSLMKTPESRNWTGSDDND